MSTPRFENLAFEGGGAKGAAYAGCLDVLQELGHLDGIKRIAGTSAGSMTAAIVGTGGGSAGLQHLVASTDFSVFVQDKWGPVGDAYRLVTKYGIHTAGGLVKILKAAIERYSGHSDLTFGQLRIKARDEPEKFKELFIVGSNLTRKRRQVFDAETNADVPIWLAVRASMSIPVLFEPVVIGGDHFVDGGLAWNYPIDMFDEIVHDPDHGGTTRIRNPLTLGFYLEPHAEAEQGPTFVSGPAKIDSVTDYGLAIMDYFFEAGNSDELHPDDQARTVFVDDLGVRTTDFGLHGKRLDALVQSGRTATEKYFSHGQHRSGEQ